MSEQDEIIEARKAKVAALRETGIEPYPVGFHRTDLASELHDRYHALPPAATTEDTATVAGRVVLYRSFGKLIFVTLADVSGRIQLYLDESHTPEQAFALAGVLDLGDWVGATGEAMTTKRGELSVRVADLSIQAKALRPLPEKWHGLTDIEQRSRMRYVDLAVNENARRVALVRARIVSELRHQFEKRGYLEVETPILISQATGALARPFLTHHHALDIEMNLRIATELFLKRLIVGGLEKVFEIGRIFRNEGIDAVHNPEFTMLESYEAFADYHDIAAMVEDIVAAVAEAATGSKEIEFQGRKVNLAPPFRRARMVDLVGAATGRNIDLTQPLETFHELASHHGVPVRPEWGPGAIVNELFEVLVADQLWDPTYVLDYPVEVSPLARRHRDDPLLTERFELIIAGDEYANAFSELNDPADQRIRFEAQVRDRAAGNQEAHPIDEDFIRALEYGMPPTGGLGIGVDRLVMLLTDVHHIRDVILFPTMKPE